MTSIRLLIDNEDYFQIESCSLLHKIDYGFSFKEANIVGNITKTFKDFLYKINEQGKVYCSLYVDDKLFIENYITVRQLSYNYDINSGGVFRFSIKDRFHQILKSKIVKTLYNKNIKTVQQLISLILEELEYNKYQYQKPINKVSDFIVNGKNISIIPLKQNILKYASYDEAQDILGEVCVIYDIIISSNGYDTLTIDRFNSYREEVFGIFLKCDSNSIVKYSNVNSFEKIGENDNSFDYSKIIVLNTQANKKKGISDKNTSLIVDNKNGMPNSQIIKKVNKKITYQGLKSAVTQEILGLNAVANSYVYSISNVVFDINNNFFEPNRLVAVQNDYIGKDMLMNIMGMQVNISVNQGSDLLLNLVYEDCVRDNVNTKHKKSIFR